MVVPQDRNCMNLNTIEKTSAECSSDAFIHVVASWILGYIYESSLSSLVCTFLVFISWLHIFRLFSMHNDSLIQRLHL